jgi:hypothetical protein
MGKIFLSLAAGAALFVLALPGPAGAAERRADGVRNADQTEFSSAHRRWHRRHYVRRHGYRSYGYRSYRPYGYGYGYPYGYYRPGPSIGLSFGFGPRYGWW